MSWLSAISTANRETRQVEADERARETSIRNLHRMRQQDADAALERDRQARAKASAQSDLPGLVDIGAGSGWTPAAGAPVTETGAAPGIITPTQPNARNKRQQVMPGERAAVDIYNTQRYPDQTRAESARLARHAKPTPPSRLATSGYDPQAIAMAQRAAEPSAATARREAERRRLSELLRLNPPQDQTPVVREPTAVAPAAASATQSGAGGDFEAFKQAIFGQESRNGAVDTSRPNYAGALGKGQILESTFNGLKAQGKIPADYDWRNPAHNEAAAVAYMQEAWQAAGGDPRKAAAYYYGGPKAIAGGQINTYRDLRNPRAPDTHGYADQVVARMRPGLPTQPAATQAVAATTPTPAAPSAPTAQPGVPTQTFAAANVGGRGDMASQDLRILNLQMEEIKRRLQFPQTAEIADQLRGEYIKLATQAQQVQVRNAALQAVENDQALTALAQAAGTPFAQTPQGFVLVRPGEDGQWRAASPPVDRMSLITHVVGILTGASAAIAAEQRKSDMKVRENVATEQVKGTNTARTEALKHQHALQELIARKELEADDVLGVETNPTTGQQMVRTRTGVFEVVPSVDLGGGMMSAPSLRAIPMR